jgi:single-strand DNA-binding protein
MANLNKVLLMGNLTRDPEVRYTPKGTAIANIGLAINRRWTTETGEQKEEATFVDIEVWGRQAETANQYLKKGSPLFVEGRLRLDQWDDKESGQKRSKLKIVCEHFQFIGAPRGGGNFQEGGEGESAPRPQSARPPSRPASRPAASPPPADEQTASGEGEDNIPF